MSEDISRKLTPKQRLFVEAYLQCWNATEAARRAGYKGNDVTLACVGYQNYRKLQIAQIIAERIQGACMSTDEALMRLAEQGRGTHAEYIKGDGAVDISKLVEDEKAHLIKKLKYDKDGALIDIEFHDAQAALEKILKAGGAYKDKGDGVNVTVPITVQKVAGFDDV